MHLLGRDGAQASTPPLQSFGFEPLLVLGRQNGRLKSQGRTDPVSSAQRFFGIEPGPGDQKLGSVLSRGPVGAQEGGELEEVMIHMKTLTQDRQQEVEGVLRSSSNLHPASADDPAPGVASLRRHSTTHDEPIPIAMRRPPATENVSQLPRRLGIYEVESLLGEGGMGEVFLAWDGRLQRHVAIKRVHRNRVATADLQDRFLREARSVAALDHPSIVKVHDVIYEGGRTCLVMEFVEGETLAQILERDGSMDVARVLKAAKQVAVGLAEAHAKGLIHRDLKTENVMVRKDGCIKILDFGVVLAPSTRELTGAGFLVGTARAMSPEQARGEALTPASDLFSLGVLLYEMLGGVSPFESSSQVDTLMRVVTEPAPLLRSHAPTVPPGLERLVSRLLEKDPRWRPESARRVAAELEVLGRSAGLLSAPSAVVSDPEAEAGRQAAVTGDDGTARAVAHLDSGRLELDRPVLRILLRAFPGPASGQGPLPSVDTETLVRFGAVLGRGECRRRRGLFLVFERAADAVAFALDLHRRCVDEGADVEARPRIGIHLGEIRFRRVDDGAVEAVGEAVRTAEALASAAAPGRTLLGRAAFDLARNGLDPSYGADKGLQWLAHGTYDLAGEEVGPQEVFEVGAADTVLRAPSNRAGRSRKLSGVDTIEGWRPATGSTVPQRPHWVLQRRTGRGGAGEVWLARHAKTGDSRVFKFCYEASRLRSLQREITLFRLLKDELGDRDDIARVLDWNFAEAPYFIESEYTAGGDLATWAKVQGGIGAVPMTTRLGLVAQVARALAAAHSVGVLHKDVKPSNILIATEPGGGVRARLADFGVGSLTEHERLEKADITAMGLTEATLFGSASSLAGTRLYWAPEVLEGKAATPQTDIFALGVTLFQVVVGDLTRALAPGWWREVDDELLREDVADSVDGSPERRFADASRLAERLERLELRRAELEEQSEVARLRQEAEAKAGAAQQALVQMRRRRNLVSAALFGLLVFSLTIVYQNRRIADEAAAAQRVARSLELLFLSVSPWEGVGRDFTVWELLARGEAQLEAQLQADPRVRARLLTVLGRVHCEHGSYDKSEDLLRRATALQERLFPAGHPELAESLAAFGRLHMLRGEVKDAVRYFRQAAELQQRSPEDLVVLLEELAIASEFAGRLKEAQDYSRRSLELRRRLFPDPTAKEAFTVGHLAWLYRLEGDLGTAQRLSDESERLHAECEPKIPALTALSLISSAGIDVDFGRLDAARPKIRRAVDIFRSLFGERHLLVGAGLNQLADVQRLAGELETAESLHLEALALFESIFRDQDHFHVALSHAGLGRVYQAQGRPDAAEKALRKGLGMFSHAFDGEHFRIGFIETDLAALLAGQGRLEEAETLSRHAVDMLAGTLRAEHWRLAYARAVLGSVLLQQGHRSEARPLLMEARDVLLVRNGGFNGATELVLTACQALESGTDGG